MSQKPRVNQKHMTLSDRIFIEQALAQQMTFKEIARFLQKDPTTISKEVKKHRIEQHRKYFGTKNDCKFVKACTKMNICSRV